MKLRQILFPTDFSEPSRKAWPHAAALAEKSGAQIHMLYVRAPYTDNPAHLEQHFLDVQNYETSVRDQLEQVSQSLTSGERVKTHTVRNLSPGAGILDFIAQHRIDLTVMGTHGRSALVEFFLGSVAERVVRHAPCPVLTVGHGREAYRDRPGYRQTLVGFDFSEHSVGAVRTAAEWADNYQARLHILYVVEQPVHPPYYAAWRAETDRKLPQLEGEIRTALSEALGKDADQAEVSVRVGAPRAHQGLVGLAEEISADLIVVGTHGLSGLERALLGSTAEAVVRTARCPVLTVKLEDDG